MPHLFIETKLHAPCIHFKMFWREHLLERLKDGSGVNLILISGEAGSGKSTLIYQWVKKQNLKAAWYAPDVKDNDPGLFFRYVLAALASINDNYASMMQSYGQNENCLSNEDLVSLIIKHSKDIEHDHYLIIDNYHLITNEMIHESMSYLLNHLPPRLHIIILTRYRLPFPISNLRVQRQLLEITAGDLRFSKRETEQYFKDIVQCELSRQQLMTVFTKTEGWIGGIQLFAISLRDREANQYNSGNESEISKAISDYLIDEVYEIQNEDVKHFLSKTCFLDKLNAEISEALTGLGDASIMLHHTYLNNMFLITLDAEGKWYRYHHSFAAALRKQYTIKNYHEIQLIHKRAAEWFAQKNMFGEALNHAIESGDDNLVVSIIENNFGSLIGNHEALSFQKWILRISKGVRNGNALLMLIECNINIQALHLSLAEDILSDFENRRDELLANCNDEKKALILNFFLFEKCYLAYWKNPYNVDIEYFENKYNEFLSGNLILACGVKLLIAASYIYKGEITNAQNILETIADKIKSSESPLCVMRWFYFIIISKIHGGQLYHAELLIEEASKYLHIKGLEKTPLRLMINMPLAWLFYYRNELSKAAECLEDNLVQSEETGIWGYTFESLYLSMLVNLVSKNRIETIRTLHKIQLRLPKHNVWSKLIEAFSAFLALLTGDEDKARQCISEKHFPGNKPLSFLSVEENIIYILVLRYFGKFLEAVALLSKLKDWCAEQGMGSQLLLIEIISAAILSDLGRNEQAEINLKKALVYSEREGHIRFFVDWASAIHAVLRNIMDNDFKEKGFPSAPTIMKACGIEFMADRSSPDKILSNREMEVLQLIMKGYKNKDISCRMFISLDTVKTHIRHIYEKLKVNSKIEAIQQAEKLKIIGNTGLQLH